VLSPFVLHWSSKSSIKAQTSRLRRAKKCSFFHFHSVSIGSVFSEQVADLQANLKHEQAIVEEKKQTTDLLIINIGQEKSVVDEQKNSAAADEAECSKIAAEVVPGRLYGGQKQTAASFGQTNLENAVSSPSFRFSILIRGRALFPSIFPN
jgi:hypothetical protein